jgi:hypothetical protein
MTTLFIKSLLTSLCQREEKFPSIKRGLRGVFLIGVQWGKRRFFNQYQFDRFLYLFLFSFLLLFAPCPLLHAEIQDRVVAFVDNTAITLSDLETKYAETLKATPNITKEEVLNTMVNRMLLLREAKRFRLEAPSEEELLKEYIDLKIRAFIRIRDQAIADFYQQHLIDFQGKELDEVRDQIETYLIENELNQRLKSHIDELRGKSCVKVQFNH